MGDVIQFPRNRLPPEKFSKEDFLEQCLVLLTDTLGIQKAAWYLGVELETHDGSDGG